MKPNNFLSKGRLKPGEMNGTEAAYAAHLELLKHAGQVLWYAFEAITFKLAPDTRYTPDFLVLSHNGYLEAHEVKGHWMDDAKVKIRLAAALFPMRFLAVFKVPKKQGGGWRLEDY